MSDNERTTLRMPPMTLRAPEVLEIRTHTEMSSRSEVLLPDPDERGTPSELELVLPGRQVNALIRLPHKCNQEGNLQISSLASWANPTAGGFAW